MSYSITTNLIETGEEWVDRIPSTWALKRFKYCSPLVVEKAVGNGELPYVGLENVESWTGRYKEATEEKPDAAANRFACGDVLFGKLRPYLAKVLKPNFEGRCTGELLVLRPKLLDGRYLQYLLLSDNFIRNVDASTYGAKMPRAEWGFIGNLKSPIPPRPKQTAIADFLDRETARIDALIAKEERLLGLLEEKRTALISDVVTGKVTFGVRKHVSALDQGDMSPQTESGDMSPHSKLRPRQNADLSGVASAKTELKDSGIEWLGRIPKDWEVKKLKYIARLQSGDFITTLDFDEEGEFPVYGGNGLRGYCSKYNRDGEYALIGRQGQHCGNVHHAKGKIWASEHAVVATALRNINVVWMVEILRAMNLNQYSISAAQPGLAVDRIINLFVPVPNESDQVEIAGFISAQTARFDALRTKINRAIELLREKRTALISAAVTGKIEIEGGKS